MSKDLKRIPVKYIRDYIKKDYSLRDECYICGSKENLELHHIYSVSELFHSWCEQSKIKDIKDVEHIMSIREVFYEQEKDKLSQENLFTLCKTHHEKLHNIYGQRYPNSKAPKVLKWLNAIREKNGR